MEKRRGGAKRQVYARDVREKKAMEIVGGSHEEEGSRHLGAENGDPAEGGFADGRQRRHEGGNCFRKRRVRFAGEEERGGHEGGGSRDEAVVPCEEGEVAEGAVTCVRYRSPTKLRSRDGGGKKKVVYGDSEEDEGFAKKRMRRRKATSKGGVMEVQETGDKEKEKSTLARKEAVDNLDVAGKRPNTGKDEETARERDLGIGKRSSQKKRKSQRMESENDAGINKEAKGIKRNKHEPKWLGEECRMCHQCQRSDKDRIVRCESCKRKRFCAPCIKNW